MKNVRLPLAALLLLFSALFAFGCAPRGETKTLDEVLRLAKFRYDDAVERSSLSGEVEEALSEIEGHLSTLEERAGESEDRVAYLSTARAIDAGLQKLVRNTGYTTRPAFGEIIRQYQSLAYADKDRERLTSVSNDAEPSEWEFSSSAVKLLVARTYTLLSQELETSEFRVKPRSGEV